MTNFKGIYHVDNEENADNQENGKYFCPDTGAHFHKDDLSSRLELIQYQRNLEE